MERNKKNTFIGSGEPMAKKSQSVAVDAGGKGEVAAVSTDATEQKMPAEINGPKGPEPTRYGDWEQNGRCTDF